MSNTIPAITAAVRSGERTALAIAQDAIAHIRATDPGIGAVTRLLDDRALADARAVDAKVAAGVDPGPLAGVPYGVKDLFDVAGLPTTAGARLRADAAPATVDAAAIRHLSAAGAVLVATLNMDEFAYGFATINAWTGTTRNPHDPARLAGGSSGGSAAAVAAGMLAFTLGSDTNGSVRVPASLCGAWGMKPTHGGLSMDGVFPFVDSFDDIGPFAASLPDLKLVWLALGGVAAPARENPRVARLGGWFARNADPALMRAIAAITGDAPVIDLPDVARARSAAFLMTAAEGGARHLPELRRRPLDFDPQVRDRLIAGAMFPATAYLAALRFREQFRASVARVLTDHDILIAPATGETAPPVADPMVTVDGERMPARAHLGRYTQPISFIGLPVIAAPLARPGQLPLGVQLIGAPGSEETLFAYAAALEAKGVLAASIV